MTTPEANRPLTGDGWIEWTGGENPVPGQRVEVKLGAEGADICTGWSNSLDWSRLDPGNSDIIAYRLASPNPPEPERDGASDVVQTISSESLAGYKVAAWRFHSHGDSGDFGHRYCEHWSTPGHGAWGVERLFTETDLRTVLSLLSTAEAKEAANWQEFIAERSARMDANTREYGLSQALSTAERQRDEAVRALEETRERIKSWPLDDKETCMCGSPVEGHSIGSGHAPVSQGDHAVGLLVESIDQALQSIGSGE